MPAATHYSHRAGKPRGTALDDEAGSWRRGGVQWRPPGAAKTRARARSGCRGGDDEVARGRGRQRTGERPGGVVVQGGRGVEVAALGDGGRAGDADVRRRRHGTDQECPSVGGRRRLRDIYRGPPFCPG